MQIHVPALESACVGVTDDVLCGSLPPADLEDEAAAGGKQQRKQKQKPKQPSGVEDR